MPKAAWTAPLARELEGIDAVMAMAKDEERWRVRIPGPAGIEVVMLHMKDEHRKLTSAGWSYRADHGWIIYSHPQTHRWHTLKDALRIMVNAQAHHSDRRA